jgi:putative flippase GtrA
MRFHIRPFRFPNGRGRLRTVMRRWATFNVVGLMGMMVQLFTLFMLSAWSHIHYLAATAVAVETAVLHNFMWHERWTWCERTADDGAGTFARLLRFNLTIGALSVGENLLFTELLVRKLEIHYLVANLMVITGCSVLNFLVSDHLVFSHARLCRNLAQSHRGTRIGRKKVMSNEYRIGLPLLLFMAAVGMTNTALAAAELQENTLEAWNEYVTHTEIRIEQELNSSKGFLAQDFQATEKAKAERNEVLSGKIVVMKMKTLNARGRKIRVPEGIIHHWRGSVFIPDVRIQRVLEQARNPGAKEQLQEDVLESRVLERDGDSIRVYLKLVRSKIVTVTYNTEHLVEHRQHSEQWASSRSRATRIAELEHANSPAEREKPEGKDRGFLWRLNSYWRYQQVNGGVLVECESLTLSRGIPSILSSLVQPITTAVARQSMTRTLTSLRSRFAQTDRAGNIADLGADG